MPQGMAAGLGECVEGRLEGCNAYWLVCRRGIEGRLGAERLSRFRMVKHGAISTAVSEDLSRVYYVYIDEGGGGFYLEADVDAPDRPECAGPLMDAILGYGAAMLSHLPGWRAVEFIVSRMMFPAARGRA